MCIDCSHQDDECMCDGGYEEATYATVVVPICPSKEELCSYPECACPMTTDAIPEVSDEPTPD
jgi:hypothetical protein